MSKEFHMAPDKMDDHNQEQEMVGSANEPKISGAQEQNLAKAKEQGHQSSGAVNYQNKIDDYDDDDWGKPVTKISAQEALELSKRQPGLTSVIRLFQILVFCVFGSGFVGFYKGYNIEAELKNLDPLTHAQELAAYQEQLAHYAGAFANQGSLGAALWYMLSALVGGLALILPVMVYNAIARSKNEVRLTVASMTMFDVIRAEIYKYSLMVAILVMAFKFTDLISMVVMGTFVIMMCLQVLLTSFLLGRGAKLQ